MSPYCPQCLGAAREREVRCPLDQQFFHRRDCGHCGKEIFPRELYCAGCGAPGRDARETLLLPPGVAGRRLVSCLALDFFTVGILLLALLANWSSLLCFLLFLPCGLFYRALGRSGGRQTFAQGVFHSLTISPTAGPVGFLAALRFSCWEIVSVFALLTSGRAAMLKLEERTGILEVVAF